MCVIVCACVRVCVCVRACVCVSSQYLHASSDCYVNGQSLLFSLSHALSLSHPFSLLASLLSPRLSSLSHPLFPPSPKFYVNFFQFSYSFHSFSMHAHTLHSDPLLSPLFADFEILKRFPPVHFFVGYSLSLSLSLLSSLLLFPFIN